MVVAGKAGIDGDQWAQCARERGWLWNDAGGGAFATLILAHGAGAPMDSNWMDGMAERLAARAQKRGACSARHTAVIPAQAGMTTSGMPEAFESLPAPADHQERCVCVDGPSASPADTR